MAVLYIYESEFAVCRTRERLQFTLSPARFPPRKCNYQQSRLWIPMRLFSIHTLLYTAPGCCWSSGASRSRNRLWYLETENVDFLKNYPIYVTSGLKILIWTGSEVAHLNQVTSGNHVLRPEVRHFRFENVISRPEVMSCRKYVKYGNDIFIPEVTYFRYELSNGRKMRFPDGKWGISDMT